MTEKAIYWLPIDSRIIPRLFSFGHVKGLAKFFLTAELLLATGVVCGTLLLTIINFLL